MDWSKDGFIGLFWGALKGGFIGASIGAFFGTFTGSFMGSVTASTIVSTILGYPFNEGFTPTEINQELPFPRYPEYRYLPPSPNLCLREYMV